MRGLAAPLVGVLLAGASGCDARVERSVTPQP
jgi:hypothetical protein